MSHEVIKETVDQPLLWILEKPEHPLPTPVLAILCGDWSYGIIPYCGPGKREALWENEGRFLQALSSYLTGKGIHSLRLSSLTDGVVVPDDGHLTDQAGHEGLLLALRDLEGPPSWNPSDMIFIGHGLGGYVHCQLASYGLRPGGFIFAGGIYSDLEVILSQKFLLPLELINNQKGQEQIITPDSLSLLIARNLGSILQAIRKKRTKIQLRDAYRSLEFRLNPLLFSGDETPRSMFRYITSPTLIIHGSSDLDVSVWNATSIEQSVHQNILAPERIILEDRDHWFRMLPGSIGRHMQDRVSGASFSYEQDERIFIECVSFIQRVKGIEEPETSLTRRNTHLAHTHSNKKVPKEVIKNPS
jgi:hypothetical protein